MKKHYIDVYNQEVLMFYTYKDFRRFLKKTGSELGEDTEEFLLTTRGCAGILQNHAANTSQLFLALDSENSTLEETVEILVHEGHHITRMLLGLVGVETTPENHEAETYLAQSIFRAFMQKFKVWDKFREQGVQEYLKSVSTESDEDGSDEES
ncbi:hypothetical protein M316_0135 [Nitrincola phage 1M3-16]|uniref:hypothetical protein n=1 Tax=Nitrincola phage 1M3-16 TaxID=1472912 RepID=UPI000444BC37|nr:hypothetical protein GJ22_gp017 [Nitrincola phage 1M3-16]AHX01200.1 hypothetical protein M316_0135 [Nitrincola phage 1M3-16]